MAGFGPRAAAFLQRGLRTATPLAWGALAVAAAGLGAWAFLGWVEAGALALVLLAALALAVVFVLGRPGYAVEVAIASARVVVGERAVGELRIRGAGRASAAGLVELPVGPATAAFAVPRLAPGAEHDELFTIPTQRRAVLTLGPVRSIRADPLGLLRRQVEWTRPEELYVHPLTVRLANDTTGLLRDLEGLTTRSISNDDVAFHALRGYEPGDDLRHVHWRSTARTSRLMIRQFEETRRAQLVVLVSTTLADYADADEAELGISIAASLAVSAVLDGKDVTVVASDRLIAAAPPPRLLDAFSALPVIESAEPFADRARVVAAELPGASVVAMVTGSVTPPPQLRLAALRLPPTAHGFAVRAAAAEELGRQAIGELSIATVPALADLPLAIRVVTAV